MTFFIAVPSFADRPDGGLLALDPVHANGGDVRDLFAPQGPLDGLERKRVVVDARQDVGRRQDAAAFEDAGGLLRPLVTVAAPGGLAEAAVRVERPRPELAGGLVPGDHLEPFPAAAVLLEGDGDADEVLVAPPLVGGADLGVV